MRHPLIPRARRSGLLALAALLPLALPGEGGARIPHPPLESAEPVVRQQLGEARQLFEKSLESARTDPQRSAAFGRLGRLYHAYFLTEAASACYRLATAADPTESRWHHLLGVLQRDGGDPKGALASFEEVIRLRPRFLPAFLYAGRLALDLGETARAEDLARRALEAEGGAGSAAAQELIGQIAEARGDLTAALAAYRRALDLEPAANRLHYRLGIALRKAGEIDAAKQSLAQSGQVSALVIDPITAELAGEAKGSAVLMQRGANAKAAGLIEQALEDYRLAAASDPDSPEARRDYGAVLAQAARYRESAEQYREAVRLEPEKALNHFVLGLVLESAGEPASAVESIGRAVELEPDYREFRVALAGRLATAGRLEEALGHFDRLVAGNPRDRAARLERAKVWLARGELPSALRDAEAVLAEPERDVLAAEALALAGAVRGQSGDLAAGIESLRAALELSPDLVSARFTLANLLGASGAVADAVPHYRRVTELEPDRSNAWLGEATALGLGGREKEAISRLEVGVERTGDPGLAFALARLLVTAESLEHRDPSRAVLIADRLMRQRPSPEYGELLVLALARSGRMADAAKVQKEMLDALPPEAGDEIRQLWSQRLEELRQAAAESQPR
ncbi:MAG: tetratricopeptide repeat protein [Acidobacteriota bacterium]